MSREEFISKQTESERRIKRRVIPMGVIYATRLASAFCNITLFVLLWIYFATAARAAIFFALGIFILLFAASFPAERDSKRQFAKLGLRCPSCQKYLIFIEGKKTAETGRCPHCTVQIFDT